MNEPDFTITEKLRLDANLDLKLRTWLEGKCSFEDFYGMMTKTIHDLVEENMNLSNIASNWQSDYT